LINSFLKILLARGCLINFENGESHDDVQQSRVIFMALVC